MNPNPGKHAIVILGLAASAAAAQEPTTLVVTATREAKDPTEIPASIDSVPGDALREDQLRVNLSEALGVVPGLVIANRQNYAQDLQVSSRGFGSRATFGVRGVRIITDGIPATMPDGQGQTASIDLDSAARIEVLRGPLAMLYGNASGGVIQVFTADGSGPPTAGASFAAGSFGMHREGLRLGGESDGLAYRADASRFATDGYREHSSAVRELANAKLGMDVGPGRLDFVVGAIHQADTQDPLGLTRAEFESNPRQADPAAIAFDTRKSIRQNQGGAVYDVSLADGSNIVTRAYFGTRQVTQYLPQAGNVGLSAGGVVDLDNDYGGAGLRWSKSFTFAGRPLRISAGAEYDDQDQTRRGYVNNAGQQGDLRRDEDDIVYNSDAYVQAGWELASQWSLNAGARYTHVHFKSTDHYIIGANPDDSGSATYVRTLPVAGLLFRPSEDLRFYASAGQGFETPTFTELAYRPGGATGLNFALRPARSNQYELGAKARLAGDGELTAAIFRIDTSDEIVVNSNVNGRADYKNASRTRRDGLELGAHQAFGPVEVRAAFTVLDATFRDGFTSGTPPQAIPSGRKLPGVPQTTAFAEAMWRTGWIGMHVAAEVRYASRIYVDEANSDSAPAATVANLRVGWEQTIWGARLREYVRADNITDRRYAGSVIVDESKSRFFEPAPGRNYLAGLDVSYSF